MDLVAAKHEGKADVPFRLLTGAEDGDGVQVLTAVHYQGRSEGGTEGCKLLGCEEGIREAVRGEQCQRAAWGGGLGRHEGGVCGCVACI